MKRYKQLIQVGNNITDIFNLPCVIMIQKHHNNEAWYIADFQKMYRCMKTKTIVALKGDWFCERQDGLWEILTNKEYEQLIKEQKGKNEK